MGVLVLRGLPFPSGEEQERAGERGSWEKWAPPQLHRAGENDGAAAAAADVQQCNVVLLVRCMTDDDGDGEWRADQ